MSLKYMNRIVELENEKHGKPKWEKAFFAYGSLQTSSKCGIQNTMFWIWDR